MNPPLYSLDCQLPRTRLGTAALDGLSAPWRAPAVRRQGRMRALFSFSNFSPGKKRRGGFTLIELMVVLVLIAIMTAMILPEMKGTYESALLRTTGRTLVTTCNLAYSQSVTLNLPHHLRLDTRAGRYWIERPAQPGSEETGLVPVRDLPGAEGKLDPRILIEIRKTRDPMPDSLPRTLRDEVESTPQALGETVMFYPDGTAEPAEISLRDREGFGMALRINPITSRIRVVKLDRKE
jgi:type II secretion system protein H